MQPVAFCFVGLTKRSDGVEMFKNAKTSLVVESIPQSVLYLVDESLKGVRLFSVKNCHRIYKNRWYTSPTFIQCSYYWQKVNKVPLLISLELFSSIGAILDPDTHASCGTPEHTPSVVTNDYFPRVPLKHICPFLTSVFLHTSNVILEEQWSGIAQTLPTSMLLYLGKPTKQSKSHSFKRNNKTAPTLRHHYTSKPHNHPYLLHLS